MTGSLTRDVGGRWTALALVLATAVLAVFARTGSDWDWVVALGDHVRSTGTIPSSVPFAVAPSEGWHNVPVLAEVIASVLAGGGHGLVVTWHLLMVIAALVLLAVAGRYRGGSDSTVAVAMGALVMGGLPWFGILRLQTFSLPLFALVVLTVARQAQQPDRGIWWVVPLVALWGNLHGAVLLGVCVLGAYLVLGRLRERVVETTAVGAASIAAMLVTPQGFDTVAYYLSVFDNVAAERGEGLWARPSLGNPFDVMLLLAALVLAVLFFRKRRAPWEYVAVVGLSVATVTASRHGLWLLMLLSVLAVGARHSARDQPQPTLRRSVLAAVGVSVVTAGVVVFSRGDAVAAVDPAVVGSVSALADDGVVLAPSPLVESLAVEGVRVWMSNPIDAFGHDDQATYLDFLQGKPGMDRAVLASDLVVTADDGAAYERLSRSGDIVQTSCGPGWVCWVRS